MQAYPAYTVNRAGFHGRPRRVYRTGTWLTRPACSGLSYQIGQAQHISDLPSQCLACEIDSRPGRTPPQKEWLRLPPDIKALLPLRVKAEQYRKVIGDRLVKIAIR